VAGRGRLTEHRGVLVAELGRGHPLQAALLAGQAVVAKSKGTTTVAGLTPNQAFVVRDVMGANGEYYVQVFDPSKLDAGRAKVVTMSWNDFLTSFLTVSIA
jgi:hypothetical protein